MKLTFLQNFSLLFVLAGKGRACGRSGKAPEVKRTYEHTMRGFWNTSDPIWTFKTSQQVAILCKVDTVNNFTSNYVLFNRTYYLNGERNTFPLKGTFQVERKDTMKLEKPGGEVEGSEILLYQNQNNTCGVFQVLLNYLGFVKFDWFDLRVTNSSVDKGPGEDCANYFKRKTNFSRQLYNSACQKILVPTNDTTYVRWKAAFRAQTGFDPTKIPLKPIVN